MRCMFSVTAAGPRQRQQKIGASVTLSMMMSTSCGHCCSCFSSGNVARLARRCAQSRSRLNEKREEGEQVWVGRGVGKVRYER